MDKNLRKKICESKVEIYKLKTQGNISGQQVSQKIRGIRKEIARELTMLNQNKKRG